MNRKRERLEIIYDVLKAVQDKRGNVKPTHILYKSNLSPQMLKDYLTELIEKEFILENLEKNSKNYDLTDKGHKYIEDYKVIKAFTVSYGLK